MNDFHSQKGMTLLEVMLALAILLLTALSASTVQSTQMINTMRSGDHFSLDNLSNNILETIRSDKVAASAGNFDFDTEAGIDFSADKNTPAAGIAAAWNTLVVEALPSGMGAIKCTSVVCNVTISWMAEIDGSRVRQYFRTSTPI